MNSRFLFRNTRVHAGENSFLMHSITYPWGEDDPILRNLREGRFDEHTSIAYWIAMVRSAPKNAIVLDVGAFAGLFSFVAVSLRPDILAIAFEPSSVTFGRLVYNIHLNEFNPRILAAHLAAWDETAQISLPHMFGLYTLCPGESATRNDRIDHTETVHAVRLDSLLDITLPDFVNSKGYKIDGRPIAAVKIDVEGVEPRVLNGTRLLIEKHHPSFICEALNPRAVANLASFFDGVDYGHSMIPGERNMLAYPTAIPSPASADQLTGSLEA